MHMYIGPYANFDELIISIQPATHVLSHIRLFVAPWIVAHQAPLPMEFSKQEYWSEVPYPTPGDLPC